MNYVIYYDICALVITGITLAGLYYKHMTTGLANRSFAGLMVVNSVTAILDIIRVMPVHNDDFLTLFCTAYYVVQVTLLPVFVLFIVSVTEVLDYFRTERQRLIFTTPYIVLLALGVINLFTSSVIYAENGIYYEGVLFPLLYLIMLFYLAYAVFYIVKFRRNMNVGTRMCLILALPVGFLSVYIQMIWPELLIQCFGTSIVFMFYAFTVQRPEAIRDNETNLSSKALFMSDMQRALRDRRKLSLIVFKIENYEHYMASLTVDRHEQLLKSVSSGLSRAIRKVNRDLQAYYLKHGLFVVEARWDRRHKLDTFIEVATQEIQDCLDNADGLLVKPAFYKVIVDMPEDVSNFNALISLMDVIEDVLPRTGQVYKLSDMNELERIGMYVNINSIIERALKNGEITVLFEPVYEVKSNRIVGAEARIQLEDYRYGLIPSKLILQAADKSGEIRRIGELVYDRICRFIAGADFKEAGLKFIDMKFSTTVLDNQYLGEEMVKIARRYGIKTSQIGLHFSEQSDVEDWSEVMAQGQILRFCGFKLGISEYGQNYSNIKRLAMLPIDVTKVDPTIVYGAIGYPEDVVVEPFEDIPRETGKLILESTVSMLKDLGIKVVVEGADTPEICDYLEDLRCDYLMGKMFGKALPLHDFLKAVKQFNEVE